MAKDSKSEAPARDLSDVVSVIGPGMEIVGDVKSDGTIRVEGRVEGSIKAAKSVVIGQDGVVDGDIETQDVVVAGRVTGTISGESRVELQESCRIEGDIRSRRIKLDEGGRVEGRLHMGTEAFTDTGGGAKAEAAGDARGGTPRFAAPSGGGPRPTPSVARPDGQGKGGS